MATTHTGFMQQCATFCSTGKPKDYLQKKSTFPTQPTQSCIRLKIIKNQQLPSRGAYAAYATLQNTHHQPTQHIMQFPFELKGIVSKKCFSTEEVIIKMEDFSHKHDVQRIGSRDD